jgi:hypothetical protein
LITAGVLFEQVVGKVKLDLLSILPIRNEFQYSVAKEKGELVGVRSNECGKVLYRHFCIDVQIRLFLYIKTFGLVSDIAKDNSSLKYYKKGVI